MHVPISQKKRSSLGLTITLAATNKISTSQSFFSEQTTTQTKPTQEQPRYSTYSTLTITTETKLKNISSPFQNLITSMDKTKGRLFFTLRIDIYVKYLFNAKWYS